MKRLDKMKEIGKIKEDKREYILLIANRSDAQSFDILSELGFKIMNNIGELGERFVCFWLEEQGWSILYHRWRCRWGEIDSIARSKSSKTLIFVEVKTRARSNWDSNGLLAVNLSKQVKLWRAAELFLAGHRELTDFACRFDVALVNYRLERSFSIELKDNPSNRSIKIGEPILWKGYELTIQNYIEGAFDRQ